MIKEKDSHSFGLRVSKQWSGLKISVIISKALKCTKLQCMDICIYSETILSDKSNNHIIIVYKCMNSIIIVCCAISQMFILDVAFLSIYGDLPKDLG